MRAQQPEGKQATLPPSVPFSDHVTVRQRYYRKPTDFQLDLIINNYSFVLLAYSLFSYRLGAMTGI